LQECRILFPYLNFFTLNQLYELKSGLETQDAPQVLLMLKLLCIFNTVWSGNKTDIECDISQITSLLTSYHKTSKSFGVLWHIGEFLNQVVSKGSLIPSRRLQNPSKTFQSTLNNPINVILANENVLDCITSAFVSAGHVPTNYELLLCTPSTPWELVQAILLRAVLKTKHNDQEYSFHPFYCIANVHLLQQPIQLQAISLIQKLEEDYDWPCSVVIIGAECLLVSSLHDYVVPRFIPLQQQEITTVDISLLV
jgi:hypothetical protein